MKFPPNHMLLVFVGFYAMISSGVLHAASLTSGSATIGFDQAAWAAVAGGSNSPGFEALILDEFFDQSAANGRTFSQLLSDEVLANPAYTGQVYAMNGPVVVNLPGRTAQPTNFAFSPGGLPAHVGSIGLGGVTRWDVNPLLGGGSLLLGDLTLQYDTTRIGSNSGLFPLNGTGWYLKGNIPPAGALFDLTNVAILETPDSLTISGDLAVTYELANFVLLTPNDQGRDVGDFRFTAVVVPEPLCMMVPTIGYAIFLVRRTRPSK